MKRAAKERVALVTFCMYIQEAAFTDMDREKAKLNKLKVLKHHNWRIN